MILLLCCLLLLLCAATVPARAQEAPTRARLARMLTQDLSLLGRWLAGRFDNHLQVREQRERGSGNPHEHVHAIIIPVAMPELGEHVFYVEQYLDGDPEKIHRQRLYSLALSFEQQAIEMAIFALRDPEAVRGAHEDPARLAGLGRDELASSPGCEVFWHRQGDHFLGATREGACRVEASGRTLTVSNDLRLSAEELWIRERAATAEGEQAYGHPGEEPHELRRVRFYECWAAAPREEDPAADWQLWRPLVVHDQGGKAELASEGEEHGRYGFELFQTFSGGEPRSPVLELAVLERGVDGSVAQARADSDSRRIGIRLPTLQVSCSRRE